MQILLNKQNKSKILSAHIVLSNLQNESANFPPNKEFAKD